MRAASSRLEGGEGVGKSTQVEALSPRRCAARGIDVVETREPGGSPGAEAIRALLLEARTERWTPEAEALLFAAARADHVDAHDPAGARARAPGCCATASSTARSPIRAAPGGLGAEAIRALHAIGSHGFLPDRTLLLDACRRKSDRARGADRDAAADRIGRRATRPIIERVAAAFAALAEARAGRVPPDRRVAAAPDEVTERLLAALEDLL